MPYENYRQDCRIHNLSQRNPIQGFLEVLLYNPRIATLREVIDQL